jgi:hypothetical protein
MGIYYLVSSPPPKITQKIIVGGSRKMKICFSPFSLYWREIENKNRQNMG